MTYHICQGSIFSVIWRWLDCKTFWKISYFPRIYVPILFYLRWKIWFAFASYHLLQNAPFLQIKLHLNIHIVVNKETPKHIDILSLNRSNEWPNCRTSFYSVLWLTKRMIFLCFSPRKVVPAWQCLLIPRYEINSGDFCGRSMLPKCHQLPVHCNQYDCMAHSSGTKLNRCMPSKLWEDSSIRLNAL